MTIALCAAVLAVGCSKKDDAGSDSCQQLGTHFSQLARAEADKVPADAPNKKAIMADVALVPKAAADLVKECRDEKWSAELRGCFLAAKSADEFKSKCGDLLAAASPTDPAPEAKPEPKPEAKPEAAPDGEAKPDGEAAPEADDDTEPAADTDGKDDQ